MTITITRKHAIIAAVAALAIGALAFLSGCSKYLEPFRDAPVNSHLTGPAEVATMPDGFSNWADKCDSHGHRVFVAYHGDDNRAAIAVIADPSCGRRP